MHFKKWSGFFTHPVFIYIINNQLVHNTQLLKYNTIQLISSLINKNEHPYLLEV